MSKKTQFKRCRKHAMFGGVCAGLARMLGWTPTRVRIAYILASILSVAFPGIFVYLFLWVIVPADDELQDPLF